MVPPLTAQEEAPSRDRQARSQRGVELTAEQKLRMTELRQRFRAEDESSRESARELSKNRRAELDGVLTDEQRAAREAITRRAGRQALARQRSGQRTQVARQRASQKAAQHRRQTTGRQRAAPGQQRGRAQQAQRQRLQRSPAARGAQRGTPAIRQGVRRAPSVIRQRSPELRVRRDSAAIAEKPENDGATR